jgi:hypothetical protein
LGRGVVGGAKPGYGWDGDALERYRQIILMAKERSMKVTLALRPQRHWSEMRAPLLPLANTCREKMLLTRNDEGMAGDADTVPSLGTRVAQRS